jgi:hypothetical protein
MLFLVVLVLLAVAAARAVCLAGASVGCCGTNTLVSWAKALADHVRLTFSGGDQLFSSLFLLERRRDWEFSRFGTDATADTDTVGTKRTQSGGKEQHVFGQRACCSSCC